MKASTYYVLAGLLVLATVPIYHSILSRRDRGESVTPTVMHRRSSATSALPAARASYNETSCYAEPSKPECVDAFKMVDALKTGRAKCVAGVVYKTSDHVIEPWPGHVLCTDPYSPRLPRGV
jgi:hypothetical protein